MKFLFYTMGLMMILNCLRGIDVGNDTVAYKNLFLYYSGGGTLFTVSDEGLLWMNTSVEAGYRILNTVFSRISTNYQLFITFISIILYGEATRFIKKESCNLCISVLLFFLIFYHPYINVLRQAIAISIILSGFRFLKEEKYFSFSLFVIFACLFHKTAVIALLLIPLMRVRRFSSLRTLFVVLFVLLLTATNAVKRIVFLLGIAGNYTSEEHGISTYAQILLSLIIFRLTNYWRVKHALNTESQNIENNSTLDHFYSRIPIVHLCLSIAGLNIPIMERCTYYFTIFYLPGIPHFIMNSSRSKSNLRITFFLLILTYIVYQTGMILFRPEWVTEFQYKFFWQ